MSDDTQNPHPQKTSLLPAGLRERLDSAGARLRGLSRPLKILLATTIAVALGIVLWRTAAGSHVDYTVLYTDLENEDAGAVVAKLRERGVSYRLAGDGTTVEAPTSEVAELRLALAAEGLPRSGQPGFESFDKLRLGATEFEQQVTYRRAMEGELARTIGTVKEVRSARVHLVLPKRSVFATREEPASAAIVVRLRPGRELAPNEVKGIVNLVGAAVPGLDPNRVALVTTDGKVLQRPRPLVSGDNQASGAIGTDGEALDDLTRARSEEALLEERTRSMLERVLGPGHVEVRVRAEIDSAKVESHSDRYDQGKTALRSEQLTIERVKGGADEGAAGVPGAESNLPMAEGDEPEAPAAGGRSNAGSVQRRSHTRNFEVTRLEERRVSVTDTVKRLAVAVAVDGTVTDVDGNRVFVPRDQAELDKIATLVKSAVGFDDARGDQITVESMPFVGEPVVDAEADETAAANDNASLPAALKPYLPFIAIGGGGLLALVVVVWLLVRRSRRHRRTELAVVADPVLPPPPDPVEELIAPIDYRAEALARAKNDPASAALVMRQWLGTMNQLPARDGHAQLQAQVPADVSAA